MGSPWAVNLVVNWAWQLALHSAAQWALLWVVKWVVLTAAVLVRLRAAQLDNNSVVSTDYLMVCLVAARSAHLWDEKRADSTVLQMAVEWDQKTVGH